MAEILEGVGPIMPFTGFEYECPHKHDKPQYPPKEEDLENDDKDEEAEAENHDTHNSSKKLGEALEAESMPRVDTSTDATKKVKVEGYKPALPGEDKFAYTVAAHHLIPGNASLKVSEVNASWMCGQLISVPSLMLSHTSPAMPCKR